MEIKSTKEALDFLFELSLNQTDFRYRGQSDSSWTLLPSIYRYNDFYRYQTAFYENNVIQFKPPKPRPPLTHTVFELEWLMVCQHYEVPTRLIDWSTDILIALFFACYGKENLSKNGSLFICKQGDYPVFDSYKESLGKSRDLAFVSTNVVNPRMRNQSGCFMMWGHSPQDSSTETYDLYEYQEMQKKEFFMEKLCIPSYAKQTILDELELIYSISYDSIYLKNGFLERKYTSSFKKIKEKARLMTLFLTDADKLNKTEEKKAKTLIRPNSRNSFAGCLNLG